MTDKTQKGPSRRLLIIGGLAAGGGLAIAAALQPLSRLPEQRSALSRKNAAALSASLVIGTDDSVTVIIPHADMGVGNGTALAQMLVEELDGDWANVRIERAPAERAFANQALGQSYLRGATEIPKAMAPAAQFVTGKLAEQLNLQITGGSTAIRFTGIDGMRPAGAAARQMLVKAAAKEWGVPVGEIKVANGIISHASGKSSGFGAFAPAALAFPVAVAPPLKDKAAYTLVGQPKPRFDIPAKVDGSAIYSADVRLPGMVFAAIRATPVKDGTLKSVKAGDVASQRGVIQIVEMPAAVAVLADSHWRAQQAVNALEIEWDGGPNGAFDSAVAMTQMKAAVKAAGLKKDYAVGDAEKALAGAAKVVEAEYSVPYLAHAAMEPVGCVAQLKDGKLVVHGAFQDGLGAKAQAVKTSGLTWDDVTIAHTEMGGAFGRRGSTLDYLDHAIAITQKTDKPVNLFYSREEDITHDFYRNASAARMRVGLDAQGKPIAFSHHFHGKDDPPEASRIPYAIPAQHAAFAAKFEAAPWGAWRSVDHSIHGFFIESMIDEAAHAAGADPLEFRLAMLADKPRHTAALKKAAEMARWSEKRAAGTGLGVALVESFGTIVAEIAEVSIGADGEVKVSQVWVAADPGEVINPNGFAQQMESGIIYGLAAALEEEITFESGAVQQSNFTDYRVIRMAQSPQIAVAILESGARTGGAGEPATPPIAAAVANAVFAATGQRVRDLPLSKTQLTGPARPA